MQSRNWREPGVDAVRLNGMEEPEFDAADLAAHILDEPIPASAAVTAEVEAVPQPPDVSAATPSVWSEAQRAMVALMAMVIVLVVIGLAVMAGDGRTEPRCWDDDRGGGLFDDAEERFSPDERLDRGCSRGRP